VNIAKVNRFLLAMGQAQKAKAKSQRKKDGVEKHIKKIDSMSTKAMKKELTMLKSKISKALENEDYLIRRQKTEDAMMSNLRKEVSLMNESLKVFHTSFQDMLAERDQRINALSMSVSLLHERAKAGSLHKMKQLESKIQTRVNEDEAKIKLILDQLRVLEKMHTTMVKSKSHSPVHLDRLRVKIENLKEKIKEIK